MGTRFRLAVGAAAIAVATFAGVDATTEDAILTLLRDLRSAGRTVIVVHHDLGTVRSYFDHVVLLNVRVVADGPITETFTLANLERAYGGKIGLLAGAAG